MRTVKLPFYILIGFNIITLLIFMSRPFVSYSGTYALTVLYIIINILFVCLGINDGFRRANESTPISGKKALSDVSKRALTTYLIFFLSTFLLKYAYELHTPIFDIGALVNKIVTGIINPQLGYTRDRSYFPFNWSIYVVICIFDSLFFIVGMLCWRKFTALQKSVFVVLTLIEILKGMGTGSSFGEIKMLTTLALVIIASIKKEEIEFKKVLQYSLYVLVVAFLVLLIFRHNMEGRAGGEFSEKTMENFEFNTESFVYVYFVSWLPERIQNLYVYVCYYLCNGYSNMEYAFKCDFDWTYFMGSNDAKSRIFELIFGIDVEPMNYQSKIFKEYYVDPYINWHSCYTWLANDVSFYGVPLLLFFIGKFCSTALVFYRKYNDLLSGIVFIIFANMIFFLFANNNYIANIFYSFILVFPYWLFTRFYRIK